MGGLAAGLLLAGLVVAPASPSGMPAAAPAPWSPMLPSGAPPLPPGMLAPGGMGHVARPLSAIEARSLAGALFVDARMGDSFRAQHLPGAVSVPAHELLSHQAVLPRNRPLVCYCTCYADSLAWVLGDNLKAAGFPEVYVLEGGLTAWQAAGGALETSE